MAEAVQPLMSADEFLLWCLDQEGKFELVDGIPVEMMAGASDYHDRIVVNIIVALGNQLRGKPCRPTTADTALRTRRRSVRRPDVMVNCAPLQGNVYEALQPRLAVEVLSKSNSGVAWERKLNEYRQMAGLDYILLVDSGTVAATLLTRDGEHWRETDADTLADVVELPNIGCRLSLADVYEGLALAKPKSPARDGADHQ